VKSVARYLGHLHANDDLVDDNVRFSHSISHQGAKERFQNLHLGGRLQEHQDWLFQQGVFLDLQEIQRRVENANSILQARRYRSHWIVCVGNVYPGEIMVDREDPSKVYCLYERSGNDTIEMADRMYPLARFIYCTQLPRSYVEDCLFAPYTQAYTRRKKLEGRQGKKPKQEEVPIDKERFWLLLHSNFLDYFLYWTEHRNPRSCQRIQARLLEDDHLLNPEYFTFPLNKQFNSQMKQFNSQMIRFKVDENKMRK